MIYLLIYMALVVIISAVLISFVSSWKDVIPPREYAGIVFMSLFFPVFILMLAYYYIKERLQE
jgi:hypothetical protein